MNSVYCLQCGHKHTYNLAKPNFCSSCGASLDSNLKLPTQKSTPKIAATRQYDVDVDEDDEDSTDVDFVPDISRLAIDVENFSEYNTFSLGSLFGEKEAVKKNKRPIKTIEEFKSEKK